MSRTTKTALQVATHQGRAAASLPAAERRLFAAIGRAYPTGEEQVPLERHGNNRRMYAELKVRRRRADRAGRKADARREITKEQP